MISNGVDVEKFKQLLSDGKKEEAKEYLEEFLASEISEEEQAQALIALASAHMEIQNAANREYLQMLDYAIAQLSNLQKRHNSLGDAINLAQVRKKLK